MKITSTELECMGASDQAINFYANTDPLEITEKHGLYTVKGCIEPAEPFESAAALIAWLDGCAADIEAASNEQ